MNCGELLGMLPQAMVSVSITNMGEFADVTSVMCKKTLAADILKTVKRCEEVAGSLPLCCQYCPAIVMYMCCRPYDAPLLLSLPRRNGASSPCLKQQYDAIAMHRAGEQQK